jgi:integrase
MHADPEQTASTSGDFSLSPHEVAKGERVAHSYLSSLKPGEPQRVAEEALDTLAAVISGGICDASSFPWHQVQPYHGALAFTILKEKGAPAHIEAMRCRADDTRKYQPVPEAYAPKEVARIKSSFKGIMSECQSLGFISDEERDLAISASTSAAPTKTNGKSNGSRKKSHTDRELAHTEVLALRAACRLDDSPAGNRDGLMISLAYHGALKTVDLIGLTIDHIQFDNRTQKSGVLFKPAQAKRARRVPFSNEEMIALEDWLTVRGNEPGALFCALGRADKVDIKRMSAAEVREICDRRAAEAGVQPFQPNDLAKSSPLAQGSGKRSRKAAAPADESDEPIESESVLFGDEPEIDDSARRISFPYHVRLGP